jgi:hypothetical protein
MDLSDVDVEMRLCDALARSCKHRRCMGTWALAGMMTQKILEFEVPPQRAMEEVYLLGMQLCLYHLNKRNHAPLTG